MKLSAIKKTDDSIWLVRGEPSLVMEEGDELIELPHDWEQPSAKYMSCWRLVSGQIKVDLALARAQKLEEIRKERDARLAETDKEWMVAMSKGIDPTPINNKKTLLRDLPEVVESALSSKKKVETIDAYEPEWP